MALSREEAGNIARKLGLKQAAPDDPIYREPPSMVFVNRRAKPTSAAAPEPSAKLPPPPSTDDNRAVRELREPMQGGLPMPGPEADTED